MPEQSAAVSQQDERLPTQQANHFALAVNAYEFLLAFGLSRVSMTPTVMGATPDHHTEWVATLSISPVAAAQLLKILEANVASYEEKFGKIPLDPNFKLTHSR